MRVVLLLPLVALALISTAAAQEQTPLNCQKCWNTAREKISECKKLSKDDMDKLGKMSDTAIASIGDDHDLAPIKACLCALSDIAGEILDNCDKSCPPEMSKGLRAEASIVTNGVCGVPKAKAKSDDNATDNSTSADGADATEGESNSTTTDSGNSTSNEADNKPNENGASSVQWSGALLTVVAALVSAVAF